MKKPKNKSYMPDVGLLICSTLFILIAILTIATASPPFSINEGLDSNYFLIHQLLFGFLPGITIGILAFFIPLNFFKKYASIFFIISYVLMFAVFLPTIGVHDGGASRWVNLFGFSFQPSEILKLTTIMYLSALLSSEKVKKPFLSFLIVMFAIGLALILQSDLSTLITISIIAATIYFSANTKLKDVFILGGAGLALFTTMILTTSYRMKRVMTLFNPTEDISGKGYHINQVLISIGSGGFNGSGLGLSAQKFGFIPESMSDSIFAIYAEELGFMGCAFLILLLIFFIFCAFSVAKKSNPFEKLLAVGIGSWIIVQSFVNIAAMTGIIPISGTPLPFLSYGGTHLIIELTALGLLLNVSKTVNNN